ncbi:MAG: hypothetical protein ACKPKO_24090, partial [Candidatus Fonsibacter sp.]
RFLITSCKVASPFPLLARFSVSLSMAASYMLATKKIAKAVVEEEEMLSTALPDDDTIAELSEKYSMKSEVAKLSTARSAATRGRTRKNKKREEYLAAAKGNILATGGTWNDPVDQESYRKTQTTNMLVLVGPGVSSTVSIEGSILESMSAEQQVERILNGAQKAQVVAR